MRRIFSPLLMFVCCFCAAPLWAEVTSSPQAKPAPAASKKVVLPEGVTEEMLAPPPVPRFMLEKPAKPLSKEEMMDQVRDAEKKAAVAVKQPSDKR